MKIYATSSLMFLACVLMISSTGEAQAQDILQGAQDVYDSVTESTQTRYKREQAEQDAIRRQQDEARWRQEMEEKERQRINQRSPNPQLNVYPPKALRPHRSASNHRAASNELKVEVFVASSCSECDELESFLTNSGVSYVRYNLENDSAAEKDYLANIGRGVVPVTRIGTTVIRGYEPDRIRSAIMQAKGGNPGQDDSWRADAGRGSAPDPQLPPARDKGTYIPYPDSGAQPYAPEAERPLGAVTGPEREELHY